MTTHRPAKENLSREEILQAARAAFRDRSFVQVSMRDIAKKSGHALGNIYYYFKDKDHLFFEVVKPALQILTKFISEHCMDVSESVQLLQADANTRYEALLKSHYSIYLKEKDLFYILFFHANGSKLESYEQESFRTKIIQMNLIFFEDLKRSFPHLNADVSEEFLEVYTDFYLTFVKRLMKTQHITKPEFNRLIRDVSDFTTAGWKELLRV